MSYIAKHTTIPQTLTLVLLVCYAFSFSAFPPAYEKPADLESIILQLQNSNKTSTPNTIIGNNGSPESIRIIRSIAGLNYLQVNAENTDQTNVSIELKIPHLLSSFNEDPLPLVGPAVTDFQISPYISINSCPEPPPPMKMIA